MTVNASRLESGLREKSHVWTEDIAGAFVVRAQGYCSRRSGDLAASIDHEGAYEFGNELRCRITVGEDYGRYQDEGTGIFGPEGVPITPKYGKVLRFDWPAAGGIVFAHSVMGSEPTRFFTRTVEEFYQIVAEL